MPELESLWAEKDSGGNSSNDDSSSDDDSVGNEEARKRSASSQISGMRKKPRTELSNKQLSSAGTNSEFEAHTNLESDESYTDDLGSSDSRETGSRKTKGNSTKIAPDSKTTACGRSLKQMTLIFTKLISWKAPI